ncbi:MAG: GNAT family N-acetyltransferase [Colwelliaceae bacterium]|nr:GNAT family N-acetyltransferase [Colwelliaceae bacterium]
MITNIIKVNYNDKQQGEDLLYCLCEYALDPMGGGEPLTTEVQESLLIALQKQTNVFSVLAYVDGKPAGLVNCVEGFSTFNAKPLVNIHDAVVLKEFRRQGLTEKMFSLVEEIAQNKGACKLTLEVLEGNVIAQNAYQKLGFAGYELDPLMGKAVFWQKKIATK